MEAVERRAEREAQRRQRELERRAKEQAKLSEMEQARLEVETYDNQIDILSSIHKEQGKSWDWVGVLASLPPSIPQRDSFNELRVMQTVAVWAAERKAEAGVLVERARSEDVGVFQEALERHSEEIAEWSRLRALARRIVDGDPKAYTEALGEFSAFNEISDLGSSIHVTVHSPKFLECVVSVNGKQAIPTEDKTLTSTAKLSVKPMPKGRFQEIYADYICGCALRVAREVLALLPANTLLITASADSVDPKTGQQTEKPVLSVVMSRLVMSRLDFDRLDPSDAVESFQHRANFKGSRKSESFEAIIPLTLEEIVHEVASMTLAQLVAKAQHVAQELRTKARELEREPDVTVPEPDPLP